MRGGTGGNSPSHSKSESAHEHESSGRSSQGPTPDKPFDRRGEIEEDGEHEAINYSYDNDERASDVPRHDLSTSRKRESALTTMTGESEPESAHFERIRTGASLSPVRSNSGHYEANPYDIDRVNTKDSFPQGSMASSRVNSRAGSRSASRVGSPSRSLRSKQSGKSLRKKASKIILGRSQ